MQHIVLLNHLAQTAAPAPTGGGGLGMFLPLALFFLAMWFLIIMPQRKRQKQHQQMLAELKPGDEVVTSGGIYGTIQQVRQDRFVLKVADSTRIEVAKAFVQTKVQATEEPKK